MAKRDRDLVWSSTDGDLRKARDPQVQAHRAAGGRVKVRRETSGPVSYTHLTLPTTPYV